MSSKAITFGTAELNEELLAIIQAKAWEGIC
jgi:hypothetical protein